MHAARGGTRADRDQDLGLLADFLDAALVGAGGVGALTERDRFGRVTLTRLDSLEGAKTWTGQGVFTLTETAISPTPNVYIIMNSPGRGAGSGSRTGSRDSVAESRFSATRSRTR